MRLAALGLLAARLLGLLGELSSLGSSLALLLGAGWCRSGLGGLGLSGRGAGLALGSRLGLLGRLGRGLLRLIATLPELLGDGLVIGAAILARGRQRDLIGIGVDASLIVRHVLGLGVAALVRVDTGVVQAQVVAVGVVPAALLRLLHDGPAALAFLLDSTLAGLGTEVARDDGTSGLHVQEVGGQRALRRVGVMGALLALLLLLDRRDRRSLEDGQDTAEDILNLLEVRVTLNVGGLTEQQVGLAEIVVGEALDQILNGLETSVDLFCNVSTWCSRGVKCNYTSDAWGNAVGCAVEAPRWP